MSTINPNCDGANCRSCGQVRVYKLAGDSNLILCQACFAHENSYRRGRNADVGENRWPEHSWDQAEVYGSPQ